MLEPVLDPQARAEADRRARRGTLQSWLYALLAVGYFAFRLWTREASQGEPDTGAVDRARMNPLAPWSAAGAVAMYGLTLATNAFTFRYDRPVRRWMKLRLYFCLVLCIFGTMFGFTAIEDGLLQWAAPAVGRGPALIGLLALAVLLWAATWVHVERSVLRRRLRARGLGTEDLLRGSIVAFGHADVSPMSRSLWHQFEAGLLWLDGRELRFVGDKLELRLAPGQATLSREVVPGSLGALLGRKGLVLTLHAPEGDQRFEVTPYGTWRPSSWTDAIERIETQLTGWQQA